MGGYLTLRIALEGAAMQDDEPAEVVDMLRDLADRIEREQCADYVHARRLMDSNGNTVGEVRVIRDDVDDDDDEPWPFDGDPPMRALSLAEKRRLEAAWSFER